MARKAPWGQRHDQDEPGEPIWVAPKDGTTWMADSAVLQAEAAGLEVGEHRLNGLERVVHLNQVTGPFEHKHGKGDGVH